MECLWRCISLAVSLAAQVEYLGGMSRVKLAWLQISVYEDHCKAMVEFKRESNRGHGGPQCRFCEADITADNRSPREPPSPALENVCNAEDCQAKMDLVRFTCVTVAVICGSGKRPRPCYICSPTVGLY